MQETLRIAAAGVGWVAPVRAGDQVSAELQEAMRSRAEAVAQKDAASLDRPTTAAVTTVVEDGRLQTQAERLTRLKGEEPEALPPTPLQGLFWAHGSTGIQRSPGQDRSWIPTVWVKDGGTWPVAAVQITPAPKTRE
jgi:hypothetical protein